MRPNMSVLALLVAGAYLLPGCDTPESSYPITYDAGAPAREDSGASALVDARAPEDAGFDSGPADAGATAADSGTDAGGPALRWSTRKVLPYEAAPACTESGGVLAPGSSVPVAWMNANPDPEGHTYAGGICFYTRASDGSVSHGCVNVAPYHPTYSVCKFD